MFEHLNDIDFLMQLDKLNIRVQYAKIILLSYDEKPIKEIQGNITGGNLSVNGTSTVRRTMNLTMLATFANNNIEDIDNEISINKKVKIQIGYKNPIKGYEKYGDIVWFPCGVFILSSASVSKNTSGWNISIAGKDKMCALDGTAGGTLPASVTFNERWIEEDNDDITIEYPTLFQIIFEAVNHWGGEVAENIIITDVDDKIKMLVKYMGDSPIYMDNNYDSLSFVEVKGEHDIMFSYGDDIGYQETDFTYPGELVLSAGETVTSLLDKIVRVLGNFEYFYDLEGRFVFQEIKNYLNTGSPLTELQPEDYTKSYNNAKFLYSLTDLDTTTQITKTPKYDNIKNDFYVWGKRKTTSDVEVAIRYHLAIDRKPIIDLAGQYMWEIKDKETGLIIRYDFNYQSNYSVPGYEVTCVGIPCEEWREELYRLALNAQVTNSVYDNYYDSELIAEWRNLFDPMKEVWENSGGWNPDIVNNPGRINFWLDFIDTGSDLGKYSVNEIGRRTKVINDDSIRQVYNKEVPDVIFIEGLNNDLMAQYQGIGQKYFVLTEEYYNMFQISTTGVSCFDKIREMMYQNLGYNTTISLTCLPKYYLEPNNIIHIEDLDSGINGNYLITNFTLPLTYNGTMNITATEVLTRI